MAFHSATREDLRIGLYVKLVGNWFAHPFSKSSFKIKEEKDLATLRALRNYKICMIQNSPILCHLQKWKMAAAKM